MSVLACWRVSGLLGGFSFWHRILWCPLQEPVERGATVNSDRCGFRIDLHCKSCATASGVGKFL